MASKARGLADLGNAFNDGALSNRNLIINGAMQVAQRGTSFVDPNGYTLDRFPVFGTVDVSRISGFSNFQYAMRITGKTGNTIAIGQQRIEGLNAAHLTGKSVTLSFYAKASTPITVGWSAATANSYDNFGASTNFGTGTFSVTTTETRYTVTIDNVPSSCANGILITFSPNNYGAFTSGTFDITGVQLEVGDTATPLEHRSYGQELALCQRFFWRIDYTQQYHPILDPATVVNANTVNGTYMFPSFMRAAPSILTSSAGTFRVNNYGADETASSVSFSYITNDRARMTVLKPTSNMSSPAVGYINTQDTLDAWIAGDAEL